MALVVTFHSFRAYVIALATLLAPKHWTIAVDIAEQALLGPVQWNEVFVVLAFPVVTKYYCALVWRSTQPLPRVKPRISFACWNGCLNLLLLPFEQVVWMMASVATFLLSSPLLLSLWMVL